MVCHVVCHVNVVLDTCHVHIICVGDGEEGASDGREAEE